MCLLATYLSSFVCIYLAALGLSFRTWNLCFVVQELLSPIGSVIVAHRLQRPWASVVVEHGL